jgi:hypothetical protein
VMMVGSSSAMTMQRCMKRPPGGCGRDHGAHGLKTSLLKCLGFPDILSAPETAPQPCRAEKY